MNPEDQALMNALAGKDDTDYNLEGLLGDSEDEDEEGTTEADQEAEEAEDADAEGDAGDSDEADEADEEEEAEKPEADGLTDKQKAEKFDALQELAKDPKKLLRFAQSLADQANEELGQAKTEFEPAGDLAKALSALDKYAKDNDGLMDDEKVVHEAIRAVIHELGQVRAVAAQMVPFLKDAEAAKAQEAAFKQAAATINSVTGERVTPAQLAEAVNETGLKDPLKAWRKHKSGEKPPEKKEASSNPRRSSPKTNTSDPEDEDASDVLSIFNKLVEGR